MQIRRVVPADRERMVDIWLRAVRATHTFLTEDDIGMLLPHARAYLTSGEPEIWVLCEDTGPPIGFMGLAGSEVESLFLDPDHHRRGGGRRLLRHAQDLRGALTVSVNEQNPGAVRFYEACGFVVDGRTEVDDEGRPFPLLHMSLEAPSTGA